MELHKNPEMFSDAVVAASEYFNVAPALIEKDYYVTLILKRLNQEIPGLLFKGGTSLSKCYKLIDRFSEDIDLTLDLSHFTQAPKRKANKAIIRLCKELGFEIENKKDVEQHSHGHYNCYNIEYPIHFSSSDIKPYLKVEMVFIQKAYPDEYQIANSFIETWLTGTGNLDAVKEFGLEPFEIKVQSLERTFVDKVFALCDYAMQGETIRQSRHIYDIAKLLTRVNLSALSLPMLIENVRADRKANKTCVSAQDGVNIPDILQNIIDKEIFRKDYEDTTLKLLTKPFSYDEAISCLNKVIESYLFESDYPGLIRPDKWIEYVTAKERKRNMRGRGPESLRGLNDIGVYEDAKKIFSKNNNFEKLYYGEKVFKEEEKAEHQLMLYLAYCCEDDKDRLLRVFKSSAQYRKDKPKEHYENMATECLNKIREIKEENAPKKSYTPIIKNKSNDWTK